MCSDSVGEESVSLTRNLWEFRYLGAASRGAAEPEIERAVINLLKKRAAAFGAVKNRRGASVALHELRTATDQLR